MRVLESFCAEKNIDNIHADLNETLKKFYAGARSKTRELYSKKSLMAIRYGLQKHFEKEKGVDIVNGNEFKEANKIYSAMLIKATQEGKGTVQHKTPLSKEDLLKLYTSFNLITPKGLQDKAFVDFMLYFCNRGRENLRALKASDFIVNTHEGYIEMKDTAANERGYMKEDTDQRNRIYKSSSPLCPFDSLSKYLSKLNPNCEYFFQRPKVNRDTLDSQVWYENIVIGKNNLGIKMKSLSKEVGLSKEYTNLCLKATPVKLLESFKVEATGQTSVVKVDSMIRPEPSSSSPVIVRPPAKFLPNSFGVGATGQTSVVKVDSMIRPEPSSSSPVIVRPPAKFLPNSFGVGATGQTSVVKVDSMLRPEPSSSSPVIVRPPAKLLLNSFGVGATGQQLDTRVVTVIKSEPVSPVTVRMNDLQEDTDTGIVPKIEMDTGLCNCERVSAMDFF